MVQATFYKFTLSSQNSVLIQDTKKIFKTHKEESSKEMAVNSFGIENHDLIFPKSCVHSLSKTLKVKDSVFSKSQASANTHETQPSPMVGDFRGGEDVGKFIQLSYL